jgi:methionine-rich copper-binding protein CopC
VKSAFSSARLRRPLRPLALAAIGLMWAGLLSGFVTASRGVDAPASRAMFHLALLRSSPAKDSTVAASPKEIRLWFSQSPELAATQVKVTDAAEGAVKLGKLQRGSKTDEALVIAPLMGTLGAGRYTVSWRTMSRDGHVVKGDFAFTVASARTAGK